MWNCLICPKMAVAVCLPASLYIGYECARTHSMENADSATCGGRTDLLAERDSDHSVCYSAAMGKALTSIAA